MSFPFDPQRKQGVVRKDKVKEVTFSLLFLLIVGIVNVLCMNIFASSRHSTKLMESFFISFKVKVLSGDCVNGNG